MLPRPSNFSPQGRLKVTVGSAIIPESAGLRYILQIVNDHGQHVGTFSKQISKRWPAVETNYRQAYRLSNGQLKLGSVQFVQVQSDIIVVNMVAAHGSEEDEDNVPPIRYDALERCLDQVGQEIAYNRGSVHIPRFGVIDISGSEWERVEPLLVNQLLKRGINVTVYDTKE